MFEIPVENMLESTENYRKWDPKVTKMGSGAGLEPNKDRNRSRTPKGQIPHSILEVILGVILAPKI